MPSFSPAESYPTGTNPLAVLTADFNGDGRLDLAVTNASSNTVSVLLGNADGTFQPAQNSATGTYPQSVAVGDFNADGKLDLATANGGDVSVLLGNGNGTFQAPNNLGVAGNPLSVAVGDFNGDDKLDLGVTSHTLYYDFSGTYYIGSVNVLLGNGDGTFAAPNTTALGYGDPTSATVADFNGDAKQDFAAANSYGTVSVLLGDGLGNLSGLTDFAAGNTPYSVAAGDVNGNGTTDLVVANLYGNDVSVLLGDGAGGFAAAQNYAAGSGPISVVLGDFNHDTKLDIATANFSGNSVSVLRGRGDGTFSAALTSAAGPGAYAVAAGDFNGDGWLDAATANYHGSNVSVLINDGIWHSFLVSGFPSPATAGEAHTITVAALDNVLTGYTGTIHFTSSDYQAGLLADYTFTAGDSGTHTFTVMLKTAGTQSLTVTDTTTPDFTGSQVGIVVNPAAASTFAVAGFPSPSPMGAAGAFSVTATDAFGNTATNYTGTVHLASTDPLATFSADVSATLTADNHYALYHGPADGSGLTLVGRNEFGTAGSPGAANWSLPETFHFDTVANDHLYVVAWDDAPPAMWFGEFGLPGGGTIVSNTADWEFAVASGPNPGEFGNAPPVAELLSEIRGATWATPAASAPNGTSPWGTIPGISPSAQFVWHDTLVGASASQGHYVIFRTKAALVTAPTVTDYYTFTPADAGRHTFGATFWTPGTQALTATDTAAASLTGTQGNIEVTTASQFLVSGFPSPIFTGIAGNFSVSAVDIYGNLVPGYRGTMHFSSSDAAATLPGNYAFTAADSGAHSFTATLRTIGTQSLAATDVAIPSITGAQTGIQVDAPRISINDMTRVEGNSATTSCVFTVSLSTASGLPVTVTYTTANGTATAGSDYAAVSGTLTFAPGETTKTITVLVNGDRLVEPNETFFVNLNSPTNATIADGQGQGTILDDEPRININDVTMNEGNSGFTAFVFTVSLSVAYDVPVTVGYATANGTATAGSDYQAASGTLTIPAGQTSGTRTVLVNGDRLAEPSETFFVNLSNLNYGVIADGQGQGTILDDEPRISISDVTKQEGNGKKTTLFTFTVTLSAAYDQAVTMSYRTVDGTATTSDSDYVAKTGTLTFAPGETTKTITIEVQGDNKKEADETFYLDLYGPSANGLFTKSRGVGTILNDD